MREFLNLCLVLFVAVSSVQTSVVYRKYRELDDTADKNVQQQDIMQEVISELGKEVIPVEVVDIIDPMLIIKEKVILPEANTFVEIEEIKESIPAVDKKESVQNVEMKEFAPVSVAMNDVLLPKNVHEEQRSDDNNLEQNIDDENQADIMIVPSSSSSLSSSLSQQQDIIQGEDILNEDNSVTSLKQSNTTFRPTLFQQAQQSLGQFIDTIRRPLSPLTSTRAPGDVVAVAAVDTSTNPNLLQQFQASVQNIGSQITNALIPNQNLDGSSTPRPPNLLENLQTNFQNVVSNVFRPSTETSAAGPNPTPVGPFQAVISNVQSFFTGGGAGGGNRVGETTTPQNVKPENIEDPNKPVDEQNLRNSEENKDSAENLQHQEIIVGEPDDSSE